ncbi:hypothetical protein ROTAS13_02889 [Roseomonas sp. TAS13]|uniref:hypothetical protein n=1 Tax=Roseomonas TaxID=125216 RepID=UPI000967C5CA|nr:MULTISPECIES: hypothetical protein [Roseomonas]MCG7354298.1 hypothetical protein [Roseomonas mucosa]GAV35217.1 hypothetical protein ROTAS13_02889 [Roseomonas sp. TAS13]
MVALATAGLAASAADAQGQGGGTPRVAPQVAYEVSSPLAAFTDEILFGEVWRREGISRKRQPSHALR